jgi:diguanylate cyclase (GGDEF)-like protein
MDPAANLALGRRTRLRDFAKLSQPWFVALLFATLLSVQAAGFLVLGTGRVGLGLSESVLVLHNLLALGCIWIAFRRAEGIVALFWLLFGAVLMIFLLPTAVQAYETVFAQVLLTDSTWNLLYALYGAPVLMMLFLPSTRRRGRVNPEVLLDLFQVAIVVALIYSTFFFLPAQRMLPADALLHNISLINAQSLLLLIAAFVRLQFARPPDTRRRLLGLAMFLLLCAVTTFVGDWIGLKHYQTILAWFDLCWALPLIAGAFVALTWAPSPPAQTIPEAVDFFGFLGTNLVLVAMLSCISLLTNHWKQAYGETLTNVAIAASLLAFTLRLALTQFHQQQEIAHRKAAQAQLSASHLEVGRLLDSSHRQTAEITQISELGSLLQACASREEVFRLVPERLRRLFPGASGSISLFSASRNRVESVARWGTGCPPGQIFLPEQCWGLRRGCTHSYPGGASALRCAHLLGDGPSVCIPLIASGEAIGLLIIQNDAFISTTPNAEPDPDSDGFARRRQLASSVAEYVAVAIANLGLREALRVQAVRDPLTGLYNRRYMQEFLERELHSARRKRRSVAVMMLDLDHFKRYNDNFGHSAGDQALAAVGEILLRCLRAEDVACRYGGEEFALILPECSLQQAAVRAEEIRRRVKDYRPKAGQPLSDFLTASIGIAAFDETTDHLDLLLKFADDALYQAKREGRDRVVLARPAALLPNPDFSEKVLAAVPAQIT